MDKSISPPLRVLITGAAGNIGYSLAFMAGQGRLLGSSQRIILHLLDLPFNDEALKGIAMELNDCSFPLLYGIVPTIDPEVAFKDIDFAVLCGARPRSKGMERKDLLTANAEIFENQGKLVEKLANKNVKICVVGNPANTNALILLKNAPSINPRNITALTRLDQNRAVSQISEKIGKASEYIKNVLIWGNHSSTQYPDLEFSYITEGDTKKNVKEIINDENWVQNDFIKIVQERGAAIIAARKTSSVASAANAACDHMRDWFLGTKNGDFTSMAVYSNGEYGVPSDIIFSFPVTIHEGEWKIVEGLEISDFSKSRLEITAKELVEEKNMALNKN